MKRLAMIAILASMGACGGAGGGGGGPGSSNTFSCLAASGALCVETSWTTAYDSSTLQSNCTAGHGTAGTGCSHAGAVGGCSLAAVMAGGGLAVTNWYYSASGQTAAQVMMGCAGQHGTFVNP